MADPLALACEHKNITDYSAWGGCGTDYCSGWNEWHCRDCGYFIISCPCGCENGVDTISTRQRRAIKRRQMTNAG